MVIRNEKPEDYRIVEEMIKEAFWNLSVPGCNEHYFAHQVRKSAKRCLSFTISKTFSLIHL